MPEVVNTSFLGSNIDAVENPSEEIMVKVEDVSMVFNMANETMNNLKEYAIALAKGQLRFKEFRALDDVSLEVHKGDVFGILGTNGSGKSTLLKIIAGVLEPSEGTCTINGNIAPLIELGAGFDMELTARENIYLNGALLGYSKGFIEDHFDEIVDFAEIETFLDMPLKNYSSGMVARIAFAIATVIIPDILIVDEVLSVGDFMFQQKCERRISQLIEEHGVTVLIVSHDNFLVERLCNKAIWIEKGHVRMLGAAKDVCQIYRMIGGREGNPESEQLIVDALFDSETVSQGRYFGTIQGDTLGSYSVKLAERTHPDGCNYLVLTPAYGAAENYASLSLAKKLDCPIVTVDTDSVSDITIQGIKRIAPNSIILVGNEKAISQTVINELLAEYKPCHIKRISGHSSSEIALNVFKEQRPFPLQAQTAAISYEECTGDLTTLSAYFYAEGIPLFFYQSPGVIDQEVRSAIESNFDRLMVIGGTHQFPEESIQSFRDAGIEVVRICGKDPFDANALINKWLDSEYQNNGIEKSAEVIISSFWKPEKAFTLGIYGGANHAAILLDDPGNLDSVAQVLGYIKENAADIDHLLFVGDGEHFNEGDKTLLEKALLKAKATSEENV